MTSSHESMSAHTRIRVTESAGCSNFDQLQIGSIHLRPAVPIAFAANQTGTSVQVSDNISTGNQRSDWMHFWSSCNLRVRDSIRFAAHNNCRPLNEKSNSSTLTRKKTGKHCKPVLCSTLNVTWHWQMTKAILTFHWRSCHHLLQQKRFYTHAYMHTSNGENDHPNFWYPERINLQSRVRVIVAANHNRIPVRKKGSTTKEITAEYSTNRISPMNLPVPDAVVTAADNDCVPLKKKQMAHR